MVATPLVIAVYGTLRRGERNHPLLAGARLVGQARVHGRLHEMSESSLRAYPYPALVHAGAGETDEVVVELYELADGAALAAIDRLEAFDPADEAGSEYVRREVGIRDGPVPTAWVYIYNGRSTELGDPIEDGDWIAREEGRPR